MNHFYVACDLGMETGQVVMGHLHDGQLQVSDVRRFANAALTREGSVQWNVPQLYQEIMDGLTAIGLYEEPISSVSCTSWPGDYLLFDSSGALITPTFHPTDPRTEVGVKKVSATLSPESVYDETGATLSNTSMLFQLAAESPRRLKRTCHILPIADGFNFLLSGVPRIEVSMASATQLYSLRSREWSESLLKLAGIPATLFPTVVPAGTLLGPLRAEIAKSTRIEDARVVTSCSHETVAALAGLPASTGECWAFLFQGNTSFMGVELIQPIINDEVRELGFTNQLGYRNSVLFARRTNGLHILQGCQQFWDEKDRGLDGDLLSHLAGSATPFESLIDPADPRFLTPGDMPLKIQAFCRETNQSVPRKPGPIYRCILESLALLYRKLRSQIEELTGREIDCVYVLGDQTNSLLNHFAANALQLPVVIVPSNSAAVGSIVVQALAQGHIGSLEEARDIIRHSLKMETIVPHATIWDVAYDRFVALGPREREAA